MDRIFYIIFFMFSMFYSTTLTQTIKQCRPEKPIEFGPDVGGGYMDGYINAQLNFYRQKNIIFIENMTFNGYMEYHGHPRVDLSVDFNIIKAVRVQRIIDYKYNKSGNEIMSSFCNLGFIENDKRLPVVRIVEEYILRIAEDCIEKVACDFDPNEHKIGDDIHVKRRDVMIKSDVTTQDTFNTAIDILLEKIISRLIKAKQTVIRIPAFNISTSLHGGLLTTSLFFNSSGGYVDILKYIKRAEDFTFLNVDHRFTFNLALNLSAGIAALHNMTFISSLSAPIDGNMTIDMASTTLWLQVTLDHTENPCRVIVDKVAIDTRGKAADFSKLMIRPTSLGGKLAATGISLAMNAANVFKSWWSSSSVTTTTEGSIEEVTTTTERQSTTILKADELLDSIPGSRDLIVTALANQLENFIKRSIESIRCKEHKPKCEECSS